MKTISGLTFCFMISVVTLMGQRPDSLKFQSLGPYDFHFQYLKTDPSIMIDVREPFEFKRNRIKEAINIPSSGNIERAADTLNKEFTYFLYCSSGFRSANVAKKLYDMGFRNLVSLKGGIIAWKKDGMKVEKKRIRR